MVRLGEFAEISMSMLQCTFGAKNATFSNDGAFPRPYLRRPCFASSSSTDCLGTINTQTLCSKSANPSYLSGEFDEAAHLKWLDEHPTKRPKVKEARKQVSGNMNFLKRIP